MSEQKQPQQQPAKSQPDTDPEPDSQPQTEQPTKLHRQVAVLAEHFNMSPTYMAHLSQQYEFADAKKKARRRSLRREEDVTGEAKAEREERARLEFLRAWSQRKDGGEAGSGSKR